MMFNKQKHLGGVTSRIHETCLVDAPVVIKIDGHEVELCLRDAFQLCAGLAGAIERVKQSEREIIGDGTMHNVAVIASPRSGMSLPRSKLGDSKFIYSDGVMEASTIPDLSALAAFAAAQVHLAGSSEQIRTDGDKLCWNAD